jgi:hypothetical protein
MSLTQIKYILIIGFLLVVSSSNAWAHYDACLNPDHKIPPQAKVGDGAEEINSYWCRHASPNAKFAADYICTIYSPNGDVISEGGYRLYELAQHKDANPEERTRFDADKLKYDSGGIHEIFLDTISPELSFRANGGVSVCQVGGNEIVFQFSNGKITGIRFSYGQPMIKVIPSD